MINQTILTLPKAADNNLHPTTIEEITKAINQLPKKKAPDPDSITNKMLNKTHDSALQKITNINYAKPSTNYFPAQWKNTNIIFIHKQGKPHKDVKSCRPISLLNTLSKLIEKIIKNRLDKEIKEKSLIPNQQFGFRTNHGTIQQVDKITQHIKKNWTKKKKQLQSS